MQEVFEPGDGEPSDPELKSAGDTGEAAVCKYVTVPSAVAGAGEGPLEIVRVEWPAEKCCLILRGTQPLRQRSAANLLELAVLPAGTDRSAS